MKTLWMSIWAAVLTLGVSIEVARAAPGDAVDPPGLDILEPPDQECLARSRMCMSAGSETTQEVSSMTFSMPQFARVSQPGSSKYTGSNQLDDDTPWTIVLNASLRHHAVAGNAVFLVYDAENPKALAAREVTAVWQAPILAGDRVGARLTLSPDEGFRVNHTYRIRIVQLLHGKEVILAEGQVRLM